VAEPILAVPTPSICVEKSPLSLGEDVILKRSRVVKDFILLLASQGHFSAGGLKRAVHRLWKSSSSRPVLPDCFDPNAMFDKQLFIPGDGPVSSALQPRAMARHHMTICPGCRALGRVPPTCYFSGMLKCVTHGWKPPLDSGSILPRFNLANSPKVKLFETQVRTEFENMISNNVVAPIPRSVIDIESSPLYINPIGAVIKNSDIHRARALVGVEVSDSASLAKASQLLIDIGQPKIKCRITTDCTGSGLNAATYSPSFAYPSLSEGLKLVEKDCYLAKGDVSRYFNSFPFASASYRFFAFVLFGVRYWFTKLPFGFTSCPYYTSTWGAEFYQWFLAIGISTCFMVDDWLVTAPTLEEAKSKMTTIATTLESVGLSMAKEKFDYGQRLVFIGFLIDTVSMTIRIDSVQAAGFRMQLIQYINDLKINHCLPRSILLHVAGKLNWYSEIVQTGRLHVHWLWVYAHSDIPASKRLINAIEEDLIWWSSILKDWADDHGSGKDYAILCGSELVRSPGLLELVQSDASGLDGFGYVWSALDDSEYQWYSSQWPADDVPGNGASHEAELRALHHYVVSRPHSGKLIVWISDSQSACWSVNRGHCSDPRAFPYLKGIYHHCDALSLQIVALWVPRAANQYTDVLSHYSHLLSRSECSGSSTYEEDEADPGFD